LGEATATSLCGMRRGTLRRRFPMQCHQTVIFL